MEGVNMDMQYLISVLTAIICVGGLIYFYVQEKKRKPSLTAGKMFNLMFIRNRVDILVVLIIGISVSEAIWASFVSLKAGSAMPAIVRILAHGSIQAASILCALNLNTVFISWWEERTNGAKLFRFLLYALGVGALPFINAIIIAIGVGDQAYYHFMGLFLDTSRPFSFSHFPKMGFEMAVTTSVLFVHWFFLLADMLEVAADGGAHTADAKDGSDINKKITKKGEREQREREVETIKNKDVSFLLNFTLDNKAHDVSDYINKSVDVIDGLSTKQEAQVTLAKNVKDLVNQVNKANNTGSTAKKDEAKKKVREMWQKSPKKGEGFGFGLPK